MPGGVHCPVVPGGARCLVDDVISGYDITSTLMTSLLVDPNRSPFSKVSFDFKRFENHCIGGAKKLPYFPLL